MPKLFHATMPVLVTPAPDLPGAWIARCLSMDIVTQGTSVPHAFRMASEAVALAVSEDLAEGLDPRHREQSDDVYWQTMDEVMRDGESGSLGEERAVLAAVAVLNLTVATEPKLTMPDAWMIAKLDHGSPSRRHS